MSEANRNTMMVNWTAQETRLLNALLQHTPTPLGGQPRRSTEVSLLAMPSGFFYVTDREARLIWGSC